MKNKNLIIGLLVIISLAAAAVLYFVYTKCTPDYMNFQAKTSYYQVTPNLDSGGHLYAYASAARYIRAIEKIVDRVKAIIKAEHSENPSDDGDEKIKAINFVMELFHASGLSEIDGIGFSSIALDKDLDHSTFYMHHLNGRNKGLIWHINGSRAHMLKELYWLPRHTVIANFSDFRLKALWDFIKNTAQNSKIPEMQSKIAALEPMLSAMGVDLPQLLDSISGVTGVVITLDPSQTFALPGGKIKTQFPIPAASLVFQVKNHAIFDLIKAKLPMFKQGADAKDQEILTIPLPAKDLPFPIEPVIVKKGDLLFVATSMKIVNEILGARDKENGLVLTREFAQIKERMPNVGNSFRYLSPRLFEAVRAILMETVKGKPGSNSAEQRIISELLQLLPEKITWFSVDQTTENGIKWSANHSIPVELMALAPVLMASGFSSAMALPGLTAMSPGGQQKRALTDMRNFSVALESYITDFNKLPEVGTLEKLKPLMQPFYIKELPMTDPWGSPYYFQFGGGSDNLDYFIGSAGPDGRFSGWGQPVQQTPDEKPFTDDIIIKNGQFILPLPSRH